MRHFQDFLDLRVIFHGITFRLKNYLIENNISFHILLQQTNPQ